MDDSLHPAAARYLARLPDGEASYPECQVKGSVLRGMLESSPAPFPETGLPRGAAALVTDPPLASAWVHEVSFNALLLAHEAEIPERTFVEWVYSRNRKLFGSPLYRVLFLVVSPERLLVGMSQRWSAFRRGTDLVTLSHERSSVRAELRFPPHLYEEHTVGNLAVALRAACDAAGGKDCQARIESIEETSAQVLFYWR